MSPERYEELLVKVADAVAGPAEREELMTWIADKPDLRSELEQHLALRAVTDGWMSRLEADLAEDRARRNPVGRALSSFGVGLLLLGLLILTVAGFVLPILDPGAPLSIQIGMGLSLGGFFVLLVHVIRNRLKTRKEDLYRKVIR